MSKKIGFALLGLGLLLLIGSCNRMNTAYQLRGGHEMTTRVKNADRDSGTIDVTYKFKGETYERTYDVDPEWLRKRPNKVTLVYTSDDPGGAVPLGDPSMSFGTVLLPFIGALGCLVLGAMFLAYTAPSGRAFSFTKSKAVEDEGEADDDDSDEPPEDELPLDYHLRPPP